LNNDLVVTPGWIDSMIAVAEANPKVGLVNPTYNQAAESLGAFLQRARASSPDGTPSYLEVNECNGACLLIRRAVVEAIGGLDEVYGLGGFDDADYSRRAQIRGFCCVRSKRAFVFHWENVTYNSIPDYWSQIRRRNREVFEQRWGSCKQLAMMLTNGDAERLLQQVREGLALGRVGVRLHIVGHVPRELALMSVEGRWRLGIPEHNNLKWQVRVAPSRVMLRAFWGAWASVVLAFKVFGRRWKKPQHRVRAIVAPGKSARVWLRAFQGIHGAPVYASFDACPVVDQEWRWVRSIVQNVA